MRIGITPYRLPKNDGGYHHYQHIGLLLIIRYYWGRPPVLRGGRRFHERFTSLIHVMSVGYWHTTLMLSWH